MLSAVHSLLKGVDSFGMFGQDTGEEANGLVDWDLRFSHFVTQEVKRKILKGESLTYTRRAGSIVRVANCDDL